MVGLTTNEKDSELVESLQESSKVTISLLLVLSVVNVYKIIKINIYAGTRLLLKLSYVKLKNII